MKSSMSQNGSIVKTITVDKKKLIDTLNRNKEKHLKDHEEGVKLWTERMKDLGRKLTANPSTDLINKIASIAKPSSHVDEYNTALSMLEYDTETTAELDHSAFRQYILGTAASGRHSERV